MKFPEFRLPKLKFRMDGDDWETYDAMDPTKKYQYRDVYKNQQLQRADEIYPETMTSRIIVVTIAAILSMVLAWYVLGFAQFSGIAFKNSVQSATDSNTSSAVSSSSGQVGSGQGAGSEAGVSEPGSVESELARFEQQPDETPVQPRSLEEFRRMQCMDFDTYLRNYYQMVSPENAGLHWYLSSFTGDKYDWSEVYKIWEEITNNNYAAYMAMYNGSDDVGWKDGSSENYISADLGQEGANSNASGLGVDSSSNSSSGSDKPGDLTMGGVSLKSCLRSIKLWKIFWTLMIGLLVWLIGYKIAERNLAVQNQGKDNRHLLQYPNDQHIQMPEEMQRNYDYFPDVGAHAPVQVASMISHVMLLNKGVKTVLVARRADSDIYSESGELLYNKGEVLLDEDGEPIMDEMPMFDKKFGVALFNSAKVLDDKRARVFYSPAKIPYNPKNDNRDKLKNADKVSDMINKYWHFPEYEPQRPAGAYLVDTAPVNTMILAITRAGKGQTYIEPVLDMWTREDKPSNMVINDPKGELLVKFYVRGTVRGYQIVQFNLINIMKTDVYNRAPRSAVKSRCAA